MALDLEAYYRQRDEERQWQRMLKSYCCAICRAELVMPWSPDENRIVLRCGWDRTHQGYVKKTAPIIKTLQSIAEASPEDREAAEQAIEIYEQRKGGLQ